MPVIADKKIMLKQKNRFGIGSGFLYKHQLIIEEIASLCI